MSSYIHEQGLKLRQKVRAVVIDDAGKVLLVRPHGYDDDDWALVGGGVSALNFVMVLLFLKESPRFLDSSGAPRKMRKFCLPWGSLPPGTVRSLLAIFATSFR